MNACLANNPYEESARILWALSVLTGNALALFSYSLPRNIPAWFPTKFVSFNKDEFPPFFVCVVQGHLLSRRNLTGKEQFLARIHDPAATRQGENDSTLAINRVAKTKDKRYGLVGGLCISALFLGKLFHAQHSQKPGFAFAGQVGIFQHNTFRCRLFGLERCSVTELLPPML